MLTIALLLALGSPPASPNDGGAASGSPRPGTGIVTGTIAYDGPPPPAVLNPEAATRRSPVEVDRENLGLRDAAVWLDGVSEDDDDTGRADPAEAEPIEVDQFNYEFIPRVLTVEAGRAVEFLNSDVANHGVTASGPAVENRFNVTTPAGGRYEHRFVASRRPVALGCPIHAAMSAWIFVFDHPFHTVTDDRGNFRLPDVPAGRHTLFVHHPEGGLRKRLDVEVRDGETVPVEVRFVEDDLTLPSKGR